MTSMPNAAAATSRYQQKQEIVLARAAELFNANGLKATTLASIADSVGLATNSITYYYRKKEDLAQACLLRTMAAFERITAEAAQHATPPERLRACLLGHAQLQAAIVRHEHPPLMLFNDTRAMPETHAPQLFAAYANVFRGLRGLLDSPDAPNGTGASNASEALETFASPLSRMGLNARAHLLLSVINWMSTWLSDAYEPEEFPRTMGRVADVLLHGMGGSTPSQPLGAIIDWQPVLHTDARQEAFLRTATLLLNEQGYRGASVEKIAARLKRSKGAFYHHNEHKQDLILACFERTFEQLRQALCLAQQHSGSGRDRLFSAALALVRFQVSAQGPMLYSSALSALPGLTERVLVRRNLRRLSGRVAALLVDGLQDGSVPALDTAICAQVVMASLTAAAELRQWVHATDDHALADLYVRPLFEGLQRTLPSV